MKGGIYMNNVSLIYNNSILDIDNFIDSILHKNDSISNLPICEITEKPLFFFITIKNFYTHKHNFELFYKNKFRNRKTNIIYISRGNRTYYSSYNN